MICLHERMRQTLTCARSMNTSGDTRQTECSFIKIDLTLILKPDVEIVVYPGSLAPRNYLS